MKKRTRAALGAVLAAAALAVTAAPAVASASDAPSHLSGGAHSGTGWPGGSSPAGWSGHRPSTTSDITLVHGVQLPGTNGFPVDIYVVKNLTSYKELSDVTFGTVADLGAAFPGWVTPGFYLVDVVAHGGNPFQPALLRGFSLGVGQSKTVAAYLSTSGSPTLGVFANDVSATNGDARVQVFHLADAPTVGVCADGSVPVTSSFSNGQTAEAEVPASSYSVTVTSPATSGCGPTTLFGPATLNLPADMTTLAYAIGVFPSSFTVVTLTVPDAN